jgi:PhnB protein
VPADESGSDKTRGVFDPSRGYPSVVPYHRYSDPEVGIRWFTDVLGAMEVLRLTIPDGRVGHAEFLLGSSVISLGLALTAPPPFDPTEGRHTLRHMTLVFVDDVDFVARRAVIAGGAVVDPPTDQSWGLRQAIIRDPEGYLWEPAHHVLDVEPEQWGAQLLGPLPG